MEGRATHQTVTQCRICYKVTLHFVHMMCVYFVTPVSNTIIPEPTYSHNSTHHTNCENTFTPSLTLTPHSHSTHLHTPSPHAHLHTFTHTLTPTLTHTLPHTHSHPPPHILTPSPTHPHTLTPHPHPHPPHTCAWYLRSFLIFPVR